MSLTPTLRIEVLQGNCIPSHLPASQSQRLDKDPGAITPSSTHLSLVAAYCSSIVDQNPYHVLLAPTLSSLIWNSDTEPPFIPSPILPHNSYRLVLRWPESAPASSQTNTYSSIIHIQWVCQSFKGVFPRLGSEIPITPSLYPSSFLQVNCHHVIYFTIGAHDSPVAPSR